MPFAEDIKRDGLFSDCVQEDKAFELLNARYGGEVTTGYGKTKTVQLLIATPKFPHGAWLSLIGEGLVGEVAALEPQDFPSWVVLTRVPSKKGELKTLRRAKSGDEKSEIKDPPADFEPEPAGPTPTGGYGSARATADSADAKPF